MRFEHTNSYAGSPEQVFAMLTDTAFREEVCTFIRSTDHAVGVSTDGAHAAVVVVEQTQVPRKLPAVAQKFVGDTVQIVQREQWGDPTSAAFSMEIPGKPGHLRGEIVLRPATVDGAPGTDQVFTGEVKVSIPLVGGKLEGLIGELLRKALAAEGKVGADWLSR